MLTGTQLDELNQELSDAYAFSGEHGTEHRHDAVAACKVCWNVADHIVYLEALIAKNAKRVEKVAPTPEPIDPNDILF